jgi:two-component system chemotaxis response regulator CheB
MMETCRLIVIGTSMGGLTALEEVLSRLPENFQTPVVVVLHRSVDSTGGLVQLLRRHSRVRVKEPLDKEPILPGHVYIAPPDYHLMVDESSFALSTDAPELYARPSIDVLFETAAEAYGAGVVAVVMTGASSDGARGAAKVKAAGGMVIVQNPQTAESPLMPQAALRATATDRVLDLAEIGSCLSDICEYGTSSDGGKQPPPGATAALGARPGE